MRPGLRLRVGVVANEFFDPSLGGRGGFGWAARAVAETFAAAPELGVDVIFLSCHPRRAHPTGRARVEGTSVLLQRSTRVDYVRSLRRQRVDVLLTIDYRPNYWPILCGLPRTPVLVWVRDPRTPEDTEKILTLRIPGQDGVRPQGIDPIDCTSLRKIVLLSRLVRRPVRFASTAPEYLLDKARGAYELPVEELSFLPNPVGVSRAPEGRSGRPTALFLARLDPYKRPWLYVELARAFPEVEFLVTGEPHFHGPGAWTPSALPGNVRLVGHVDGAEKARLLSSAWVLVNTSIHEGLPVSFLEALACETPIVSCNDPEGVVSRFGVYTGRCDGAGLEGLPRLQEGLASLLEDRARREQLGRAGRAWVEASHSRAGFLQAFSRLCDETGIGPLRGLSEELEGA